MEDINLTCDEIPEKEIPERKLTLFVINYSYVDTAKGVAIVAAYDAKQANDIFKRNSNFNGSSYKLCVHKIQEINNFIAPDLLAEEYLMKE